MLNPIHRFKLIAYDIYNCFKYYLSKKASYSDWDGHSKFTPRLEEKIFVIGMNKTGTTSVKKALIDLGYTIGHQGTASSIFVYENKASFQEKIIKYCESADAFQDIPFSVPGVYKLLYEIYPRAKFILTVRDDADKWFNSMSKFYLGVFGGGNKLTPSSMFFAKKYRLGYAYIRHQKIFRKYNFFDSDGYKKIYNEHIDDVLQFFRDKEDQLLELNIAKRDAYKRFCEFLGDQPVYENFPWENKTIVV